MGRGSPICKRNGEPPLPSTKEEGRSDNPALVTGFRLLTAIGRHLRRAAGRGGLERDARSRRCRRLSAARRRPGLLALHALKLLEDARPLPDGACWLAGSAWAAPSKMECARP